MKNSLNRLLAGIACTALIAGLSVPAHAAEAQPEPYAISAAQWSRKDFSQDANPDVFTATYDRALYNAIRQTLVDGTSDTAPAYTMVGDSEYSAVKNLLGRMEGVVRYEHHVPENFTDYWQHLDYFAVSAAMPENYQAPFDFIQPIIAETAELDTDSEKVEYLNDYLCTLLSYKKGKTAGVTRTFAQHSGELQAACGSYARAFKFLCGAADIPCFTISTDNHTWNMVYADGQWLHVDVSLNDLTSSHSMLLRENYPNHPDRAPEQTAFLQELFVPGSTK
nr:transglutaminase domain-containing protein [uncultured Dysosmobacter sp.]